MTFIWRTVTSVFLDLTDGPIFKCSLKVVPEQFQHVIVETFSLAVISTLYLPVKILQTFCTLAVCNESAEIQEIL